MMKFYVNMLGVLIEKLWIQDWCCRFQYNFRSVYCIYLSTYMKYVFYYHFRIDDVFGFMYFKLKIV